MPASIDILIDDCRWKADQLTALCDRAFGAVFADQGISGKGYEISVMACDDGRIAQLNADFRSKPTATNVLSWPAYELFPSVPGEPPALLTNVTSDSMNIELGDIAISFDSCQREARAVKIAFDDHVLHLLIHSCLHLLGYGHENDADAARMESLETRLLETLGISDPY